VLLAEEAHAAPAGAVRLEAPTRHVEHVRATYVQQAGKARVWAEFNTGSLWSLPTCKHEDSRNCYYDAKRRGNGKGRSFANIKGKTYYVKGR
jgi:hypothetical protein